VTNSGQLKHIIEESFEDAVMDAKSAVMLDILANTTNEDDLLYFVCISNHYLCLVKNSSMLPSISRHDMQFSVVSDSGANYHMFQDKALLETLSPSSGSVLLGDGKTNLKIQGAGTVRCKIGSIILALHNVWYIPDLSNLFIVFLHIQSLVINWNCF
jgi:hypothetical protein